MLVGNVDLLDFFQTAIQSFVLHEQFSFFFQFRLSFTTFNTWKRIDFFSFFRKKINFHVLNKKYLSLSCYKKVTTHTSKTIKYTTIYPKQIIKRIFSKNADIKYLNEDGCSHEKYILAIEKRNHRERNRVRAINISFQTLGRTIPSISQRKKRTSKVKILIKAIQYIQELEALLQCDFTKIGH